MIVVLWGETGRLWDVGYELLAADKSTAIILEIVRSPGEWAEAGDGQRAAGLRTNHAIDNAGWRAPSQVGRTPGS